MLAAAEERQHLALAQLVALAELVAAEQVETIILLERQGLQIRAAAAAAGATVGPFFALEVLAVLGLLSCPYQHLTIQG
jgi:hypothetical protein